MSPVAEPAVASPVVSTVAPTVAPNALPQIAQLFLTEWSRLHQVAGADPAARLRPDLLTVELRNALTTSERTLAQTANGRTQVKQRLDRWIDLAYPRLANQVESLLNCYVTWTDVDIEPESSTVRVRIGLRELALM